MVFYLSVLNRVYQGFDVSELCPKEERNCPNTSMVTRFSSLNERYFRKGINGFMLNIT